MFGEPITAARQRVAHVLRWALLATPVGLMAGVLSAAFIIALDWATDTRTARDWLIWLLPLAGLVVGITYATVGRGTERGSNLIIEQIHDHKEGVPARIVPVIFGASVVSHLFGASVGREGAALQLAAGAADPLARRLRLGSIDRSLLLITAVAGGFGSVFGVPVAGAIFALEVHRAGRIRYEALVPAFVASFVGDAVVRGLGVEHTHFPTMPDVAWSGDLAWRTVLLGVVAGLVALAFSASTHLVRNVTTRLVTLPAARPALGACVIVAMVLLLDWRDYQGISIQLALDAQNGSAAAQWAAKFILTAVSIGVGFVGGEVIPLVVIGALVGASYADLTGGNIALFATIGSVAVLAGAANTPIACTILGLELFGGHGVIVFAVACAAAYATSGRTGIYHAQRVSAPKHSTL